VRPVAAVDLAGHDEPQWRLLRSIARIARRVVWALNNLLSEEVEKVMNVPVRDDSGDVGASKLWYPLRYRALGGFLEQSPSEDRGRSRFVTRGQGNDSSLIPFGGAPDRQGEVEPPPAGRSALALRRRTWRRARSRAERSPFELALWLVWRLWRRRADVLRRQVCTSERRSWVSVPWRPRQPDADGSSSRTTAPEAAAGPAPLFAPRGRRSAGAPDIRLGLSGIGGFANAVRDR